jgi:hypothetical protein
LVFSPGRCGGATRPVLPGVGALFFRGLPRGSPLGARLGDLVFHLVRGEVALVERVFA